MTTSRSVITGIGVIAPNGIGVDAYWSATLAGKSGLRQLDHLGPAGYPTRVGGTVPEFVAGEHLPGNLVAQTDRWTAIALAAADMALEDAGVRPAALPEYEFSVITASSSGGNEF